MRAVRIAFVVVSLAAGRAQAQVALHDNQVRGQVRFTNVNPEIVAELDAVHASSWVAAIEPTAARGASSSLAGASWASAPYEITVHATPEGSAQLMRAGLRAGPPGGDLYVLASSTSPPVFPEPEADVAMDLTTCAGLLLVVVLDESGAPAELTDVTVSVWVPEDWEPQPGFWPPWLQSRKVVARASEVRVPALGDGLDHRVDLTFTTGTDAGSDLIRWQATLVANIPCDAVVPIDVRLATGSGGTPLPRLVGALDVLGHSEILRAPGCSLVVGRGPWGNERVDLLDREPSSGSWELENLLPSSIVAPPEPWNVEATTCLQHGFIEQLTTYECDVLVPDTGTLDLEDLFVTDPGLLHVEARLAGPPAQPEPMLADADVADGTRRGGSAVSVFSGSEDRPEASPATEWAGRASSTMTGATDVATGEFRGGTVLALGGPRRTGATWDVRNIVVAMSRVTDVPGSMHVGYFEMSAGLQPPLAPGAEIHASAAACVSEVDLTIVPDAVRVFDPELEFYGRGARPDFEGRPRGVGGKGWFRGQPRHSIGAASSAHVEALMAEGLNTISPSVRTLDPSGGTSRVSIPDFDLDVGCRQVINLSNRIRMTTKGLPSCTGPGLLSIEGDVVADRPVARIAWALDGGPWNDACAPCGTNPHYRFDVNVTSPDSRLVVRAWSEDGLHADVTAFTSLTGEPSARDLRPDVEPLRVARAAGARVTLTWEERPSGPYTVHQGTLQALWRDRSYDHAPLPGGCLLPDPRREAPIPAGNVYWLVTESCEYGNGSFGRDSFGRERPATAGGCR